MTNVEDIIRQRIEAALRKAEANKASRSRRQQARAAGLAARHARKLYNLGISNATPAASGA